MGFFSWKCKVCGHSMRAEYVTDHPELSQVVVIESDGSILRGEYDGYGRVITRCGAEQEFDSCGEPECYHLECWKKAGEPTKYTKGSDYAEDQGYFFGPGDPDYVEKDEISFDDDDDEDYPYYDDEEDN